MAAIPSSDHPDAWRRLALGWLFGAFALFLLGNGSHALWDRDEPRYARATAQMRETGDWVIPRFNDEVRYDKPPLTYWLMAPAMAVFGENEFAARFPAAAMGALRVLAVLLLARAMGCGPRGGHMAAACAALWLLMTVISKAATTDAGLSLTVVAAMGLLWLQARDGFSRWRHAAFWGVLGLSILVKGPVGPAIVAMAALAFHAVNALAPDRGSRLAPPWSAHGAMRLASGTAVMLAVALPWVWMAWVRTEGDFITTSFQRHVVERAQEGKEGHTGPFFYYLLTLVPSALPLCAPLLCALPWLWQVRRSSMAARFLWCWFVPGFAMFSAVATKLPHYIAPLMPAMALGAGLWWDSGAQASRRVRLFAGGATIACGAALLIGPAAAGYAMDAERIVRAVMVSAMVGGGALVLAGALWLRGDMEGSVRATVPLWSAFLVLLFVWGLPSLNAERASKQLAEYVKAHAPAGTRMVVIRYNEPSLFFYWGQIVEELGSDTLDQKQRALDLLAGDAPVALIIPTGRWAEDWPKDKGLRIPAKATMRYTKEFFIFEQGRRRELAVVGNW